MKVCHMTSAHDSTDVRIFRKECVSLAAAGYDTYLIAQGESREDRGVHVVGVGPAPKGRLQRMTTFARTVYRRALELDADLYHIHDPELLPYACKLKQRGKKVIFDSHENVPAQFSIKTYLPKPVRRLASIVYKAAETNITKRLDAVAVPCTFDGVNIFEGRAKRVCILANYPILEDFQQPRERTQGKEEICYVGSLTYSRGIQHLVQATFRAGKRLLLVGAFADREFEERVRRMPEYACVTYLGEIPNAQVANAISGCVAGAFTDLNIGQYQHVDTFGVKVYEYISLGLPVLLPDAPYTRAMVKKYKFGVYMQPENVDSLAKAIGYLCSHPEEARQMGENGRRAVEKEFNWKTQEVKLLALYRELQGE
ncbi:MAG TPA: glycosyltransferase [Candidatus Gemmiger avistercoris]|uniref:Glycosyltransferase n=1 Tax=Candidatus Gemmiger avistercoris TaxID=2838606 RepID=A0A9D2FJN6_9FIRM|nr:glycosyltransferase [uncultured Subdoligranulum sp.]HIZ62473.1 glycosyltransferase [Candidatus Gemmiger avistercoris]